MAIFIPFHFLEMNCDFSLLQLRYQDESTTLVELFGSRATKTTFGKYLRRGEKRCLEKSMEALSDVHHVRLQQLESLEKITRAKTTQLGSSLDHKYDWPSRWLTKAKVGGKACKGTHGTKLTST